MQEIRQLKERLCKELEEYSHGNSFNLQTLQVIDTIAHTVKNLNKILEEKAKEESRYNEGYYYANDGRNSNYSNGRMNASYSNHYPDRSWDGYDSRRYSMGDNMIIEKLRNLMNETRDERTRQEFQTFIDRMEHM